MLRDIPNQRDVFALLAQTPGIVMPRPDGLKVAGQVGLGHGAAGSEGPVSRGHPVELHGHVREPEEPVVGRQVGERDGRVGGFVRGEGTDRGPGHGLRPTRRAHER